jgi:hypothetical protein
VKQLVKGSPGERSNELRRIQDTKTEYRSEAEKKVLDISPDLWSFLEEVNDAISEIDSEIYRRATTSTARVIEEETVEDLIKRWDRWNQVIKIPAEIKQRMINKRVAAGISEHINQQAKDRSSIED